MFAKIRAAFERYGFAPVDTPAIEYASTLTGKYGADEKLMYRFRDQGDRDVALRYDLTVPFARYYLANRNDLPKPFKRYQIAPVWRADNPQRGRYREFWQCDVDTVGTDALTADADCIAAVAAAIKELGVGDITIRINNRKILDGLFSIVRVLPAQAAPAMRLIDKLDKGDAKKTESEMETLGIPAKQLFKYLNMPVKDAKNLQSAFGKLVLENKALADGVGELATVLKLLEKLGVPNAVIDLKLVRGLDYYTGMICEILLTKLPALGSVGGGGRYDNLIGAMSGGKTNVPAVGMSIGIDRLIAGLEDLKVIKYDLRFEAIVFNLDASLSGVYSDIARELRASGIGCDLYYQADPMDKQFKYAEKKNIILGIFVGEDEIKKGTVTLKNLKTRAQWTVKAEKLAGEVEKALK